MTTTCSSTRPTSRGRSQTGAIKHTVTGGLALAAERLNRTTFAFDGNPGRAGNPGADVEHSAADARSLHQHLLHQDATKRERVEGGHGRGLRARPDRALAAVEASSPACATSGMTRRRSRTPLNNIGTNVGPFSRTDNLWSGRTGRASGSRRKRSRTTSRELRQPLGRAWRLRGVGDGSHRRHPLCSSQRRPRTTRWARNGTSRTRCGCARRCSAPRSRTRGSPIRRTVS